MPVNVLFVCLGNICRSPTAHGVFEKRVSDNQLATSVIVDSAGTGDWHIGHSPDERSAKAALERGYDLSHLRARQVSIADFHEFDYVLAMDKKNLTDLKVMKPTGYRGELGLFLDYSASNTAVNEVPDPYYGSGDGFQHVLDLVESASDGLLQHIIKKHQL